MSRRSPAGSSAGSSLKNLWPGLLASLGTAVVLLSGCQTWTSGMSLPSPKYLDHPAQYVPPSAELPPPCDLAAQERPAAHVVARASGGLVESSRDRPTEGVWCPHDYAPRTAQFHRSMAAPVTMAVEGVPVKKVLSDLGEFYGILIDFDYCFKPRKPCTAQGAICRRDDEPGPEALDRRVTLRLEGVPLRSALQQVLAQVDLAYEAGKVMEDRWLVLVRPSVKEETFAVPVPAGGPPRCNTFDADTIAKRLDGPAKAEAKPPESDALAADLRQVLEQVKLAHPLLAGGSAADHEACEQIRTPPTECPESIDWEARIKNVLASKVRLDLEGVPLKKVLRDLRDAYGINVVPDLPALQAAGASLDVPITLHLDEVSLKSALKLILHEADLTFAVKDEVVVITTEEAAGGRLRAVTYAVADLVVPISPTFSDRPAIEPNDGQTQEAKLIKLITNSISPRSWSDNGGSASIEYFPLSMALVISQTPAVHEEIQDLLDSLRRLQDVQISVETRLVSVSDEHFEKLGLEESSRHGAKMLDETQVRQLLEGVQGDPSANVLQAPKVTCFVGQKATVEAMDRHSFVGGLTLTSRGENRKAVEPKMTTVATGFRVTVQPCLAPANAVDRPFVTGTPDRYLIGLDVRLSRLDSDKAPPHPIVCAVRPEQASDGSEKAVLFTQSIPRPSVSDYKIETTLEIPHGKTALLCGWMNSPEPPAQTPRPVVGSTAYLGHLFRTAQAKKKHRVLVLVTPRMVVQKEQEQSRRTTSEETTPNAQLVPPSEDAPNGQPGRSPNAESFAGDRKVGFAEGMPAASVPGQATELPPPSGVPLPPLPEPTAHAPAYPPEEALDTLEEMKKQLATRRHANGATYANSHTFSLDYDVDNVGPSKLAGIDVYFTHDGRHWQRYPDLVKPTGAVPMSVTKDGRYGFTLVARSGSGLAMPAPKDGDQPQVWITVDTTPPQADLYPPQVSGHSPGVVGLRWRATDSNLHPHPVTLEWATVATGPWTAIATDLEATGTYSWSPPDEAAGKVYLRLSARDQAGNLATVVTPEPVAVDVKVPKVIGVRLQSKARR